MHSTGKRSKHPLDLSQHPHIGIGVKSKRSVWLAAVCELITSDDLVRSCAKNDKRLQYSTLVSVDRRFAAIPQQFSNRIRARAEQNSVDYQTYREKNREFDFSGAPPPKFLSQCWSVRTCHPQPVSCWWGVAVRFVENFCMRLLSPFQFATLVWLTRKLGAFR